MTFKIGINAGGLTAADVQNTIAAIENSEIGPFVHKLDEAKQIINHFTPEDLEHYD